MKIKVVYLTLFFSLLLSPTVEAQDQEKLKNIVAAINSGSKYMAGVLLDKNGKSNCEYSMIDGIWVDYEPAWHTGQMIYALSRAHDVTKKAEYLKSAKKAANWWCSLQINDNSRLNVWFGPFMEMGSITLYLQL